MAIAGLFCFLTFVLAGIVVAVLKAFLLGLVALVVAVFAFVAGGCVGGPADSKCEGTDGGE